MEKWSFMRFLRLSMGLWLIFESVRTHETMFTILGGLFAMQAILNVGCVVGNCGVDNSKMRHPKFASKEETTFEEIK